MKIENGWMIDENNNRVNIEGAGDEETARKQLESLTRCSDCFGCFDCFGSGCSGCSDCFDCSGCSGKKEAEAAFDVPVIPDIHKTIFAAVSQPKALNMNAWHSCETTHCRAGWVVTLAGEKGKALETKTSTLFAAMQIYKASGYEISPVRFFDSNKVALADMQRLATEPTND